ncbi:hypothetical protein LEP1GSC060_0693 [Leptospira weilii serovar Ranarum str. ICFT]|uniref:Uncharacterized protein n=1 Tax=Leptospira weilii serovar Ranarum str. ICFT TaxID=1218598 RepID=N1WMD0_9LEPT|nr:hypothetical protein [Leptospira weilii]EMY78324.1 hypothetical protein LEP1GSC060_0693 [Leptospira weilii serovar Ranarum str. ICFT]
METQKLSSASVESQRSARIDLISFLERTESMENSFYNATNAENKNAVHVQGAIS